MKQPWDVVEDMTKCFLAVILCVKLTYREGERTGKNEKGEGEEEETSEHNRSVL
jgi:hypothetical protein